MYKDSKIIAVIPARGGSKGVPRKNIRIVHGKPLIAYTIESALRSRYIDRVIVSTDDEEIRTASLEYGADVPFLRPRHLATDEAKTIDTLLHTLQTIAETYDYIVTLQPTQPLRTTEEIDQAIEAIIDHTQDGLVSISPVQQHPILMRTMNGEGRLTPLLEMSSTVRRQDFPEYYFVNGSIYINTVDTLTEETSLNDNPYGFITDPGIDIDTEEELNRVKGFLMNNS